MNRSYAIFGVFLLILVLIAIGAYALTHPREATAPDVTARASYLCRDGKTIEAVFTDESVTLTLSDTRAFVLPHAVSGSGVRYEENGVAFIGKGNNAFLQEDGVTTYEDCVATASPATTTTDGRQQFTDNAGTFSFTYPDSVTVSGGDVGFTQSWMVNATSSGLVLAKAVLGKSFQPDTNFSEATFTVGTSPDPSAVETCLTYNPSGGPAEAPTTQTINGTTYTVFHSLGAGAGNRYDTTSYRTIRNNQCYAVEYTIHSTVLENYPPERGITAFNEEAVRSVMEGIVQSFRFTDGA